MPASKTKPKHWKPQPLLETDTIFQRRLKIQMNLHQESQMELCRQLGLSSAIVNFWLRKGSMPRITTIQAIAQHYGCQTGYLIGETKHSWKGWL